MCFFGLSFLWGVSLWDLLFWVLYLIPLVSFCFALFSCPLTLLLGFGIFEEPIVKVILHFYWHIPEYGPGYTSWDLSVITCVTFLVGKGYFMPRRWWWWLQGSCPCSREYFCRLSTVSCCHVGYHVVPSHRFASIRALISWVPICTYNTFFSYWSDKE